MQLFFIFHNFMVKINTFFAEWWSEPTSADRQGQNTADGIILLQYEPRLHVVSPGYANDPPFWEKSLTVKICSTERNLKLTMKIWDKIVENGSLSKSWRRRCLFLYSRFIWWGKRISPL
jgi:hypothetical protein